MPLDIFTGARGSQFVCDRQRGFGDAVAKASIRADAPIASCARERAAEPFLKKLGKMSQRELWVCSNNCTPDCNGNCNPANPPGQSTHERRNDGVAYSGPAGRLLRYYQRGIDVQVDRVPAFIRECAEEGWLVTQTYPASPKEAQHVNFRKRPKISLWRVRPLRKGMGRVGLDRPRLKKVVKLLASIQEPGRRHPYIKDDRKRTSMGGTVIDAVKRFQKDHGMKADGVVGERTITLLKGQAKRPPSRLDAAGIDFLVRHEGEVLYAYNDPVGFATFGVGHLIARRPVNSTDTRKYGSKTNRKPEGDMRELSRKLLDEDVSRFEQAVIKHVPLRWRKSQDRFNALVSIAFNLGEEVLTKSPPLTSLGEALQGDSGPRIKNAMMLYVKGGSPPKTLPGLVSRRKNEVNLFSRNK